MGAGRRGRGDLRADRRLADGADVHEEIEASMFCRHVAVLVVVVNNGSGSVELVNLASPSRGSVDEVVRTRFPRGLLGRRGRRQESSRSRRRLRMYCERCVRGPTPGHASMFGCRGHLDVYLSGCTNLMVCEMLLRSVLVAALGVLADAEADDGLAADAKSGEAWRWNGSLVLGAGRAESRPGGTMGDDDGAAISRVRPSPKCSAPSLRVAVEWDVPDRDQRRGRAALVLRRGWTEMAERDWGSCWISSLSEANWSSRR